MSKEDRMRSGLSTGSRGKKPHQKLKPYIVLQYLLRYSDENNVIPASNIKEYLKEFCGIDAERRGIYKDIEEINAVAVMLEEECTVDEAYEILAEDESRKAVVYDKSQRGFYVRQRRLNLKTSDCWRSVCIRPSLFPTKRHAASLMWCPSSSASSRPRNCAMTLSISIA